VPCSTHFEVLDDLAVVDKAGQNIRKKPNFQLTYSWHHLSGCGCCIMRRTVSSEGLFQPRIVGITDNVTASLPERIAVGRLPWWDRVSPEITARVGCSSSSGDSGSTSPKATTRISTMPIEETLRQRRDLHLSESVPLLGTLMERSRCNMKLRACIHPNHFQATRTKMEHSSVALHFRCSWVHLEEAQRTRKQNGTSSSLLQSVVVRIRALCNGDRRCQLFLFHASRAVVGPSADQILFGWLKHERYLQKRSHPWCLLQCPATVQCTTDCSS